MSPFDDNQSLSPYDDKLPYPRSPPWSQADVYRFAALSQTEDSLDAHQAWREKRDPDVRGR